MTDNRSGLIGSVNKYRAQIMGFAAIWIFVFHVREQIAVFHNIPGLTQIELYCSYTGFCGVDIFLFLSGWGLYYAVRRHSLCGFYKRRYRRLIAPFVFVRVFFAFYEKWDILRFVKGVTCWTFLTKSVFEPIWFIPAIAIFYLFYPLYDHVFNRFSKKYAFTAAAIAVWFVLAVAGTFLTGREDIYYYINRIPVFITGVLFGWRAFNGKKDIGFLEKIILSVMFISGIILMYFTVFKRLRLFLPTPSGGLPAFLIAIPMCFVLAAVFRLLDRFTAIQKLYGFFGKISLEFYVFQEITTSVLLDNFPYNKISYSGDPAAKLIYVLAVFLLSLAGSFLLNMFVTLTAKKMDGEPLFTC